MVEVRFSGLLDLLLNLNNDANLWVCKSVVEDLFKCGNLNIKDQINNYFFGKGLKNGNRLSKDFPNEYYKLCKIFGEVIMSE